MNKILVVTNFTPSSKNALKVAISLLSSNEEEQELILLHGYKVSANTSELSILENDRLKAEGKEKLEHELKEITEYSSSILTRSIIRLGSLDNIVPKVSEEENINLIVMGQEFNSLVEKILTQNNLKCPLFISF